jgi:peptidoglycan-N-acetylglucosamine deacetylase
MRIRWDRIGLLLATVGLLVLATIRLGTGPGHQQSAAATRRPAPRPSPTAVGCPVGRPAQQVRIAPGTGRTVALTFDDGPSEYTRQVLDVLRSQQVRASFFVIGRIAATDPGTVAAVAAAGHLVGDHTWSHRPPRTGRAWSASTLGTEIDRTATLLHGIPGATSCWFRPPAGIVAGSGAVTAARGLSIALWSIDSRDWAVQHGRSTADPALVARITATATAVGDQQHPVVLLHDGGGYRGATVQALPGIISFYRSHGFRFVRLDGQ